MSTASPRCRPLAIGFLALGLAATVAGCGESGPPRASIAGKVTVGGEPLKAGRILFTPLAPTEGPATTATIVDGSYRIERTEGPVVGQNRVVVEASPDMGFPLDDEETYARQVAGHPLPPSPVPPEFGRNSQLTVQVKAGEDNIFDVPIPDTSN